MGWRHARPRARARPRPSPRAGAGLGDVVSRVLRLACASRASPGARVTLACAHAVPSCPRVWCPWLGEPGLARVTGDHSRNRPLVVLARAEADPGPGEPLRADRVLAYFF